MSLKTRSGIPYLPMRFLIIVGIVIIAIVGVILLVSQPPAKSAPSAPVGPVAPPAGQPSSQPPAQAATCTPDWECTDWTACSISSSQTRTCTDKNNCGSNAGKPATSQGCTPDVEEIKKSAKTDLAYDELFRNNEDYIGDIVLYTGQIIQVGGASGNWYYRININKGTYLWEDTVYVTYGGSERYLEEDVVEFVGVVEGIQSYIAVLGNTIEIPKIRAISMKLKPKGTTEDETIVDTKRCGDSKCQSGESCSSCPIDCGACPIGHTRSNPASKSTTVTGSFGKYEWNQQGEVRITVEKVKRGSSAWSMIEEANMFNDEPEEGKEYILASVNVDVIETSDDKAYESFYVDFEAVSEKGRVYDRWVYVVVPDPDLKDCTIYPGADCEGWIVFEVDEDDDKPLMVFERGTDNEMWFKLY